MPLVALLSNPHSTGNRSLLPEVRNFCAKNPDIFHYEVEEVGQVSRALEMIARVRPKVLVVNGGDGTVQAALTELYHGGHFKGTPPPVAVLPNGKTNLIALDLGADGSPLKALQSILELAQGDLSEHIVVRELIALTDGSENARPVIGMFLGGAGLADTILYCRHKIYPLGLPNSISHLLTFFAVFASAILGLKADFLPPKGNNVRISLLRDGEISGRFSVLVVTTLEKLLMGHKSTDNEPGGRLKLLVVDQRLPAMFRVVWASVIGLLGKKPYGGVHVERGDMIRIEGDAGNVVLDGEVFHTNRDSPIVLRSTPPVPFLKLAA